MTHASVVDAVAWYASAGAPAAAAEAVCATRDVFQARLDGMLRALLREGWPLDEASLLAAVLGELGNNSFDHNLGQWRDVPGCWFARSAAANGTTFCIADRGVGILATLSRADPTLATPEEAIEAAFARVLSGRTPERRGNGLKFVRSVINTRAGRGLLCQSDGAATEFGGFVSPFVGPRRTLSSTAAPGVFSLIAWGPAP